LIHPTVWPQYTNVADRQTDSTGQDRQSPITILLYSGHSRVLGGRRRQHAWRFWIAGKHYIIILLLYWTDSAIEFTHARWYCQQETTP